MLLRVYEHTDIVSEVVFRLDCGELSNRCCYECMNILIWCQGIMWTILLRNVTDVLRTSHPDSVRIVWLTEVVTC
jgi:hypothetical protein